MDFEDFETSVFDFIKNNLGTYIDDINTRKTDLVLQKPDNFFVGYPNPLIQTAKINLYLFNFAHSFVPYSSQSKVHNSNVMIYATIRGFDDDTIDKYSKRYKEAIFNMIDANDSMGGLVYAAWIPEIPRDYWGYEQINNIATVEMSLSMARYI